MVQNEKWCHKLSAYLYVFAAVSNEVVANLLFMYEKARPRKKMENCGDFSIFWGDFY